MPVCSNKICRMSKWDKTCSKLYICCIYNFASLNGVISVTNAQLGGKKMEFTFSFAGVVAMLLRVPLVTTRQTNT